MRLNSTTLQELIDCVLGRRAVVLRLPRCGRGHRRARPRLVEKGELLLPLPKSLSPFFQLFLPPSALLRLYYLLF